MPNSRVDCLNAHDFMCNLINLHVNVFQVLPVLFIRRLSSSGSLLCISVFANAIVVTYLPYFECI